MNHLGEEQLNEYLDHESQEREQIELHLSACDECAARLNSLQNLFNELDTLPELKLSHDLAAPVVRRLSLPNQLPTWLTLTVGLQALLAVIVGVTAAPFVIDFASTSLPVLQIPSFSETFFKIQIQWATWLGMFSNFQMPVMPQIPAMEISSIVVMFTLAAVSMLWLIGNGLLLRNQIK